MNRHDTIKKDPRITRPLAELLKKIQELLGHSPAPTDHPSFPNTQDSPSSKMKNDL